MSSAAQLVIIGKRPLPAASAFSSDYGRPARATVTWTPTAAQVGEHVLTFTARTQKLPEAYARPRSFLVYVKPSTPSGPNEPFALNGPSGLSRWAHVLTKIPARPRPSASARIITRLKPITPEQTQNLVLALEGQINTKGEYWVRVRLPILPNGRTGWVPRGALGHVQQDLDAPRDRPPAVLGDALQAWRGRLHDPGRGRQAVLADASPGSSTSASGSPASRTSSTGRLPSGRTPAPPY